jgi:proteic killer suppression protein
VVIKSFLHKGLAEFWETGKTAKLSAALVRRINVRLQLLDQAATPGDMAAPGFDFHPLRGKPVRYSVHVNGPWCITFEWDGQNAVRVDLEQYH